MYIPGLADPTIFTLASASPAQAASNRNLVRAIRAVNDAGVLGGNYALAFRIDRTLRAAVALIVDRVTNDVMAQVPAEYVVQLADSLGKDDR